MEKLQNQRGFTAVEGLLLLIIVGIIGFTGWYVWDSNNKSNNYYDTPRSSDSKSDLVPGKLMVKINKDSSFADTDKAITRHGLAYKIITGLKPAFDIKLTEEQITEAKAKLKGQPKVLIVKKHADFMPPIDPPNSGLRVEFSQASEMEARIILLAAGINPDAGKFVGSIGTYLAVNVPIGKERYYINILSQEKAIEIVEQEGRVYTND